MTDRERLEKLLKERSLEFGDFVLASGQKSSYYIDARPTTMSAEGQEIIGGLGLRLIREAGWRPYAVGGLTMGADPVSYAVARASADDPPEIDAFSVRKEAKGHGRGRLIEGNFRKGAAVVVVEDVITSGGSAKQAVEAVEQAGGRVVGILAVVDREQGGRQTLERLGHEVVVMTTTTSLGVSSG